MSGSPKSPTGKSLRGPNPSLPRVRGRVSAGGGGAISEASLYGPVKRFLERLGYEVKLRFTLALVLQGVDRLALSERVYVAVPRPPSRIGRGARGLVPDAPPIRRLCRRLGLGLILVGQGTVAVVEEPVPYRPRPARTRAARLIAEFERRQGDMNVGGGNRAPIITAYRQDALRVAGALAALGPMRLAQLRAATGVADAARILQRDVYGWFARLGRGTYAVSDRGRAALGQFAEAVAALADLRPDRAVA